MTGPLADAVDPDDLRDHAGRDLLVRRPRRAATSGATASYAVVGTLVAFTTLQTRLFAPIGSLLSISVDVQSSLALFDRIFEYLDLPSRHRPGHADARARSRRRALDDVWFRYGDGPYALEGIDITIPAGTTTAIVGETGAGKTTLGYLVSRLYDASKGAVTIDGVDIRELTFESLAATVGVVSQETYLFHATVRENLRFAKPDATDEEVEEAARAAQIHNLIASLPEGYETVVGERGYRFSGGEKQRMAIARASCATRRSSCSTRRPRRSTRRPSAPCRRRSHRLVEGRTTIAIAHRLSTVRDADQIVVLDHGPRRRDRHLRRARRPGGRFAALAARDADTFDAAELAEAASSRRTCLPVFESVQECGGRLPRELPRVVERPLHLEDDVLPGFGALTWTVQWTTVPFFGRTQHDLADRDARQPSS